MPDEADDLPQEHLERMKSGFYETKVVSKLPGATDIGSS